METRLKDIEDRIVAALEYLEHPDPVDCHSSCHQAALQLQRGLQQLNRLAGVTMRRRSSDGGFPQPTPVVH